MAGLETPNYAREVYEVRCNELDIKQSPEFLAEIVVMGECERLVVSPSMVPSATHLIAILDSVAVLHLHSLAIVRLEIDGLWAACVESMVNVLNRNSALCSLTLSGCSLPDEEGTTIGLFRQEHSKGLISHRLHSRRPVSKQHVAVPRPVEQQHRLDDTPQVRRGSVPSNAESTFSCIRYAQVLVTNTSLISLDLSGNPLLAASPFVGAALGTAATVCDPIPPRSCVTNSPCALLLPR